MKTIAKIVGGIISTILGLFCTFILMLLISLWFVTWVFSTLS